MDGNRMAKVLVEFFVLAPEKLYGKSIMPVLNSRVGSEGGGGKQLTRHTGCHLID